MRPRRLTWFTSETSEPKTNYSKRVGEARNLTRQRINLEERRRIEAITR